MEKLERYLRFIREAERLKDVLRTAHTSLFPCPLLL